MKAPAYKYIGFIIIVVLLAYASTHSNLMYEDEHISLNDENLDIDLNINNTRHFVKEKALDRGLFHLDKAITSLQNFEEDIDLQSGEQVEKAISNLNIIKRELQVDSLNIEDMNTAFAITLKTLTLAELRVSENYALTNNLEYSLLALKYAKLHLRHALEYANMPERANELKIYAELDSLIESKEIAPTEVMIRIDKIIKEMNILL